ncbi:DNA mismatch repair protein MutS [bacterium]|nr:DNA mismatch repair protein MutS [bacterium]
MNTEPIFPRPFFEDQLLQFHDQLAVVNQKIRRISVLRILSFLLTIVGIYVLAGVHLVALIAFGVIGFAIFIMLVIRHARLHKMKQWFEVLVQINKTELELMAGKTTSIPNGQEYILQDHPFTSDLDIFGNRSLFQLIDRSATTKGREKLAGRFVSLLKDIQELKHRQKAIEELKDKPIWRQQFRAHGKLAHDENNTIDSFLNWAKDTSVSFNKPLYKLLLIINPILAFGTIFLISMGYAGFGLFVLFLMIPFAIVGRKFNTINNLHNQLGRKTEILAKYGDLFGMVEKESFHSELLNTQKTAISGEDQSTQKTIKKLSGILSAFDYRLNIIVGILLNIFLLWDILQSIRLEKWKASYGKEMESAFESLFVFDELNSLAGFAFSHPESVFPGFKSDDFLLEAKDAKHPFISEKNNVGNEINFRGWGKFQIITGANMAGKSTYLRTVGINMVLAMTGAPVLAKSFVLKPVDIFTGIKTTDSLQDGESYFFAELKRLKEMISALENGAKLFIILDEILRGTNSADKHKGSEGLVKQLIRLDASGMIATHDLALGQLEKTFSRQVINKRFEVEIKDNELKFDYKLKDGISQNLNATFLMKKMGITV